MGEIGPIAEPNGWIVVIRNGKDVMPHHMTHGTKERAEDIAKQLQALYPHCDVDTYRLMQQKEE